ncbi:MAG: hypothetical protein RSA27_05035 [Oscillospiraceae bacterium]
MLYGLTVSTFRYFSSSSGSSSMSPFAYHSIISASSAVSPSNTLSL